MSCCKEQNTSPINALVKALDGDEDYRRTWSANIAMAFKDAYYKRLDNKGGCYLNDGDIHNVANVAADNFLKTLCSSKDDRP